jgi:hypothetical protein
MAVVCVAMDLKHDRRVAVKFLGEQVGNAVGVQRFLQEIRLTASLQHPHVLSVYDSGVTSDNVLFYVMPYVEGGSLRSVLRERGPMPLRDVVRIGREVADALGFAHSRGIIHRDIKPENILFADGHALVADFGIARMLTPQTGEQHTVTGVVVGTPAYMSPEQAYGLPLDARADVYSLACVIWEMLTGKMPPVMAGVGWPPMLAGIRSDVSAQIEAELVRALSPNSADRHAGTRELADAIEGIAPSETLRAPASRMRGWRGGLVVGFALAVVALAGSAFFASPLRERLVTLGIVQLDTGRVLVAPFQSPHGALASRTQAAEKALRDALGEWDGVSVVSAETARDAMGDDAQAGTLDRAIRAARQARAGLLVRGLPHAEGDRLTVEAQTIDARTGAVLATFALALPANDSALSTWAASAAAQMLAGADPGAAIVRATDGTRSRAAWRAYARGHDALSRWAMRDAESAFAEAVAADARFAAARVWLAQTMLWSRRTSSRIEWRRHAEELVTTGLTLAPSEQALAVALSALGRREEPRACATYRSMLRSDSLDVHAWLGLGDCQALDEAVLRDPRSPSGYAFRASWGAAMSAYERAVRLSPGAHAALPSSFVERLLPAVPTRFRAGILAEDTTRGFAAQPTMLGDSVAYVPRPLPGAIALDPPRFEEALQRNGARLLAYVGAWTQRAPNSVDALEALAGVQESLGELTGVASGGRLSASAALDSALRFAGDGATSMRLSASRVRVMIKAAEFEQARSLADSLMRQSSAASAEEAHWLAGVAALTGRVRESARLARLGRTPPVDWDTLAAPLASAATLFLAQAASGVCNDEVRSAPRQLESLIDSYGVPAQRAATRTALTARATRLAMPCLGSAAVASLEARSPWDRMQQALARNNAAGVRAVFDSMQSARRERRPGGTAADYIFTGAWTLAAAGDTTAAERYADLTLNALPTLSRNAAWELTQAAALVRLMAWRADLAQARGDAHNAQQWSAAVVALWKNADVELQPVVERLRGIVESR